jgi:hypothetical protein
MYIFLLCTLLLLFLNNQINAQNSVSPIYQRLASYCHISDYSVWLKEQEALKYFLEIADYYDVDKNMIKLELERYRSQRECLRILERLPIIVGGG